MSCRPSTRLVDELQRGPGGEPRRRVPVHAAAVAAEHEAAEPQGSRARGFVFGGDRRRVYRDTAAWLASGSALQLVDEPR